MANEEYICGFWVHIHFAVCGNAVALLSQHFSRTSQMEVSWNSKKQGRKSIKLSEDESSALTPFGPDFSFGVCPSSSSSTSYDSEPVKEH